MAFRIHLFLASLSLASRALRLWAGATLLRLGERCLAASKRCQSPAPSPSEQSAIGNLQSEITLLGFSLSAPAEEPMTVIQLLDLADRWQDPHFVLRVPGSLIEITRINETLETAAFNAGNEGHPWPRSERPFFLRRHRSVSDKPNSEKLKN